MTRYFIYGLADPTTGEFRYVGCTMYPKQRLKHHINVPAVRWNAEMKAWISDLTDVGKEPIMVTLEEYDLVNPVAPFTSEPYRIEAQWTAALAKAGEPLFNRRFGQYRTIEQVEQAIATAKIRK